MNGQAEEQTGIERRYLHFLVQVGEILGESLNYKDTLQRVCEAAVRTVADMATMYLTEGDELRLVAAAHGDPVWAEQIRRRSGTGMELPAEARQLIWSVMESGRPAIMKDVDHTLLERFAANAEQAELFRNLRLNSIVVVPLVSRARGMLGVLSLCTADGGYPYDDEMLVLAEDLGRRCGGAIAKARLYAVAQDVSARFQLAALPRSLPQVPGFKFDAFYEPASTEMLVGGDWYDAFALPDGRIGMSVGDISGHGLQAAALMGSLRDALRIALYVEPDMERAIAAADLLMREQGPAGVFATANLAILDPERGTLSSIAAGHPGPLIWDNLGKTVEDLFLERGLPLGFRTLTEQPSTAQTLDLHEGSFIVFFTDGLLEGTQDYLAGEARLCEAMMRKEIRDAHYPAREIRVYCAPDRHRDDIAILTVYCAETTTVPRMAG